MIENDSLLYGLIIACPLHNCNQSCPIEMIRDLPVRERITHLSKLDKEERKNLITRHRVCIHEFEEKYLLYKNEKLPESR
jgi:hypothetical protein